MAQATAHHGEHEPTTTGLNHRKMLMWAFLGSDCMFFGTLIATYLVYKNRSIAGPLPEDVFSIPITTVSTFVLLMSSMSMVLAYSALTRNNIKAFRIWLASTAIMGMTFIAFQVFEFRTFANYEFTVECANVNIEELTPVKQQLAEKCGTPAEHDGKVEEVVGLTPRTNLVRLHILHADGLSRRARHAGHSVAAFAVLPVIQEGNGYAGAQSGRRPRGALLAFCGRRLDRHIHRGLSIRGIPRLLARR